MNTFDQWNQEDFASIGSLLVDALRPHCSPHSERAETAARAMAREGSGPGVRVNVYADNADGPTSYERFQTRCPKGMADLNRLLAEGRPGALEFGIELLARIAPGDVLAIARRLADLDPWTLMWMRIGTALSHVNDAEAFGMLLVHLEKPYIPDGVAQSCFAGGVSDALMRLHAITELRSAALPSRQRTMAESLTRYIGRHGGDATHALLVDLFQTAASNLCRAAGFALRDRGDERSLSVLMAAAGDAHPARRRLGVEALLLSVPQRAIEALGGFDALSAAHAASIVGVLLELVAQDAEGKRAPSRGWLEADARYFELAEHWRKAPELVNLCAAIRARAARPTPRLPRRKLVVEAIPSALIQQMERVRTELNAVVALLDEHGYVFASPRRVLQRPTRDSRRAAKRIERALGTLPLELRAFWDVVGGVDLRGACPGWRSDWLTDPLVVFRPDAILEDVLDGFIEDAPYALPIAPDAYGKGGYSGGALTLRIPSKAARVDGGSKPESLLEHVARSLEWDGLPGFATLDAKRW